MHYLIYGSDVGLCSEKVREVVRKCNVNNSYSVISLDCNEMEVYNFNNLNEHLFNSSMFEENKIIKCNGVQNKHLKFLESVIASSDKFQEHILILIGNDAIDNKSKIRDLCVKYDFNTIVCYPENLQSLQKVAIEKLQKMNISFDDEAPEALSQLCLGSRMLLTNEIEKISLYLNPTERLTTGVINEICDDGSETFINKVIDLIMLKKCKESIDALQKFLNADGSVIGVSLLLKRHINLLKKIIEAKNKNENIDSILRQNGIFFDRVSATKKQMSLWTVKSLNNILYNIEKNEVKLKYASDISNILMERLILNICFSK